MSVPRPPAPVHGGGNSYQPTVFDKGSPVCGLSISAMSVAMPVLLFGVFVLIGPQLVSPFAGQSWVHAGLLVLGAYRASACQGLTDALASGRSARTCLTRSTAGPDDVPQSPGGDSDPLVVLARPADRGPLVATSLMLASRRRMYPSASNSQLSWP